MIEDDALLKKNEFKIRKGVMTMEVVELLESAKKGNVDSMCELGACFLKGTHDFPKNTNKAEKVLKKAVNKGSGESAYLLSIHYFETNLKLSEKMIMKSQSLGFKDSKKMFHRIYEKMGRMDLLAAAYYNGLDKNDLWIYEMLILHIKHWKIDDKTKTAFLKDAVSISAHGSVEEYAKHLMKVKSYKKAYDYFKQVPQKQLNQEILDTIVLLQENKKFNKKLIISENEKRDNRYNAAVNIEDELPIGFYHIDKDLPGVECMIDEIIKHIKTTSKFSKNFRDSILRENIFARISLKAKGYYSYYGKVLYDQTTEKEIYYSYDTTRRASVRDNSGTVVGSVEVPTRETDSYIEKTKTNEVDHLSNSNFKMDRELLDTYKNISDLKEAFQYKDLFLNVSFPKFGDIETKAYSDSFSKVKKSGVGNKESDIKITYHWMIKPQYSFKIIFNQMEYKFDINPNNISFKKVGGPKK